MTSSLRALERAHSPISPSNFERVSSCTMSHRLAATRGGRAVSGEDARVGTAAHSLLEWALKYGRSPDQIESVVVEGARITVTAQLRTAVQVAIDWVGEHLAGRALLVERQVRLPWGKIGGWLDVATADEPFVVVDYKHGFQTVGADTPQLGLYALAALLELRGSVEGAGEATAVVIQPRARAAAVRSHVWTFSDIRDLRDRVIETLDAIRREDLRYADGPWCRWCPVAAVCPHLAAVARDAVATTLAAPELIAEGSFGAERLDAALRMAPALDHWVKQVHEVARQYIVAGGSLEGFKLVATRDGSLTVASRSDPRPEVDAELSRARLRAALRSSVALGYLESAASRNAIERS